VVLRVTLFSNSSDEDPTFCTQVGLVVCIIPRVSLGCSSRSLCVLDRGNASPFPSRLCFLSPGAFLRPVGPRVGKNSRLGVRRIIGITSLHCFRGR
jgi:hypothetical protein